MLKLKLWPADISFKENLQALRSFRLREGLSFLNVVRNSRGNDAYAARVIETGFGGQMGFGFTSDEGETRCFLSEINYVEVYL